MRWRSELYINLKQKFKNKSGNLIFLTWKIIDTDFTINILQLRVKVRAQIRGREFTFPNGNRIDLFFCEKALYFNTAKSWERSQSDSELLSCAQPHTHRIQLPLKEIVALYSQGELYSLKGDGWKKLR